MMIDISIRKLLISVTCLIMSVIILSGCNRAMPATDTSQITPEVTSEPTTEPTTVPTSEPTSEPTTAPTPTPVVFSKDIVSFTVSSDENKDIPEDLSWTIREDIIYLSVSYLFDLSLLENCITTICFSDGSSTNEKMNLSSGPINYTVTDSNGIEKTYDIFTERITYNLPVFYIEIEDNNEVTSREEYLNATIRIDSSGCKYAEFDSMEETAVLIRGRGHYSWNFDKTPYKLRFEEKTSVLNMAASKNWVLLANYVDRSLIQNYVAMEMGKIMDYIPYHSNQYPVDVFVNGTYRGVYTFGEQLEAKTERLNLEKDSTAVDTDYLIELGGADDGDVPGKDYFNTSLLKNLVIKHPDKESITSDQLDYVLSYLKLANDAVKNLENYEDYIDINSLIDWVIIHEFTYNLDCCFRRSCFLIKEKGGKLKMGPIWDFDLGFGSYYRYTEDHWATVGSSGGYVPVTWMNYLMKDDAFMKKFKDRWDEIKQPLLARALECVDTMSALVAPSAEYNFKIWKILGEKIKSQPSSHKKYDTYEKMTGRLRSFIESRYEWIDSNL